jgi:digeranylgeranylglycerophospholipid reductase
MESDWPVVIVGGGFAGLAAAERCAEEGIKCLVLEKSDEIGYPIHTSGGSFLPELKKLGIPSELYHPIENVRFRSPNSVATFRYEKAKMCVMDVRGVRQYLAQQALDSGAHVHTKSTVTDVLSDGGHVKGVVANTSSGEENFRSDVVIDASGFRSVVAQASGLHGGFDRFGRGAEYDLYCPGIDDSTAELIVGSDFAPSGYGWIFPRGQNRVRVGVGSIYPDAEVSPSNYLDDLVNEYAGLGLEKDNQIETHSGIIPSKKVLSKTVSDGVILAGDAANQPLGLVGEGIRISTITGRMAGEVAALGVIRNNSSASFLELYEKRWRQKLEIPLKISYLINTRIAQFDDSQWDTGVRFLNELSPNQFYHILKCDFSKEVAWNITKTNPNLIYPALKESFREAISTR